MLLNVYAIFDLKSRVYSRPFFCINNDVAVRSFTHLATDAATEVGRNPLDFALYCVGTYDDDTAHLQALLTHENLGLAATFKEVVNAPQS